MIELTVIEFTLIIFASLALGGFITFLIARRILKKALEGKYYIPQG